MTTTNKEAILTAAEQAFEAHLNEQKTVPGMPGLSAKPCFIAGYLAALPAKVDAQAVLYARQWELDAEPLTSKYKLTASLTAEDDWQVPLYLHPPTVAATPSTQPKIEVRLRHENGAWLDWFVYDGQTDLTAQQYAAENRGEWRYATPSVQGESIGSERAAFEDQYQLGEQSKRLNDVGDYENSHVHFAWNGWKARARLARTAAPSEIDPNVFFDALSDFKDTPQDSADGDELLAKLNRTINPAAPSEGLAIPAADIAALLDKALIDLRNNCKDDFLVKMVSAPIQRVIALTRAAAPAAKAPDDAAQKLALSNDINAVYGNTNKATTDHLWECGYRKSRAPATEQAKPELARAPIIGQGDGAALASALAEWLARDMQKFEGAGLTEFPVDQVQVWADMYEKEGGHALIVRMLRAYAAILAAQPVPQASGERAILEMELALYRNAYGTQAPSEATIDVLDERQRQVIVKDWTHEHDDAHPCEEIAAFAALYAMPPAARDWPASETGYGDTFGTALCPADWQPKFGDRRRELVKAGALVLAEIERLDRAATTSKPEGASHADQA